jgi:hypothetical protein
MRAAKKIHRDGWRSRLILVEKSKDVVDSAPELMGRHAFDKLWSARLEVISKIVS